MNSISMKDDDIYTATADSSEKDWLIVEVWSPYGSILHSKNSNIISPSGTNQLVLLLIFIFFISIFSYTLAY